MLQDVWNRCPIEMLPSLTSATEPLLDVWYAHIQTMTREIGDLEEEEIFAAQKRKQMKLLLADRIMKDDLGERFATELKRFQKKETL